MSVHEKMAFIRIIMRFQLIKVDGDRIFSILEKKRIREKYSITPYLSNMVKAVWWHWHGWKKWATSVCWWKKQDEFCAKAKK